MTGTPPVDSPPPAPPPPASKRSDRRALHGALIFFGIILVCFAFALILISSDMGDDSAEDGPRIGVVRIKGAITGSHKVLAALRKMRKNETIKAVVVRINSPGGAVAPSQEIHHALRSLAKKKPVVASLETVAASGGYYIAAGAQKILASRGTITGSIGVIAQTTNVEELLKLTRVRMVTFKTGKYKDTLSPVRKMDDAERAYIQRLVDGILAQFVDDVAKGRKLPLAKVKKLADGRVFTGEQAKKHGLVDQLGNFNDALALAAKLAKAEGDPVPVFHRPRGSVLQELLKEPTSEVLDALREVLVRERQRVEVRAPRL